MKIKIVSYNMLKGKNFYSRKLILEKMSHALKNLEPDILLLQEFPGPHHHKKNGHIDTITHFMEMLNFKDYFYGMNSQYQNGSHGNALFSAYPIEKSENINISTMKIAKRGLLHAQIALPNSQKPLHILCSHLDLFEVARKKQIVKIAEQIRHKITHEEPFILAGDFNDWNKNLDKHLRKELLVHFPHKDNKHHIPKTYPSIFPILPLDRFYLRHANVEQLRVLKGRPWNRLSDHLPLMIELKV